MNEKAYKTMSRSGAGALTVGMILLPLMGTCGVTGISHHRNQSRRKYVISTDGETKGIFVSLHNP